MEKNIEKSKIKELGLLILNTACYSAIVITSVIILLAVLSSLLSKKIVLADYSKQSFAINELLKFLVFYPVGEEFLLRGLMLHFLKKKTKYANLIQAIIFGILHLNPIRDNWFNRDFRRVNKNLKSINPLTSTDRFEVNVLNN